METFQFYHFFDKTITTGEGDLLTDNPKLLKNQTYINMMEEEKGNLIERLGYNFELQKYSQLLVTHN